MMFAPIINVQNYEISAFSSKKGRDKGGEFLGNVTRAPAAWLGMLARLRR